MGNIGFEYSRARRYQIVKYLRRLISFGILQPIVKSKVERESAGWYTLEDEQFLGRVEYCPVEEEQFSTKLYCFIADLIGKDPVDFRIDIDEFIQATAVDDLFQSGCADMTIETKSHGIRMVATSDGMIEMYATQEGIDLFGIEVPENISC